MMEKIIDFHSHILPGMDDGSASVEESLALLRMEAEQGIGHVVATPHFYPQRDTPEAFLKRRAEAEEILRSQLQGCTGLPRVSTGAEVYYFHGISHCDALEALTIQGTKSILIEMPAAPWEDAMYRELEALYARQGLLPVIAHVDRYLGRFRSHGVPERLCALPVLVQANGSFFLKPSTGSRALRMLKKDQIHLLGSDCHDLSSRPPNLGKTMDRIRKRLGRDALETLCNWQNLAMQQEHG